MIERIPVDETWRAMARRAAGRRGVRPRRTRYGAAPGLVPFGDEADKLVAPADYRATVEACHARKIFPLYHQRDTWGPPGFQWNQNGLSYCWAWSLAAAVMDCRAREGRPTVLLSPVSLGWLVRWRNQGNYMDEALAGARERGIASAAFVPDPHSRDHGDYTAGWEDDALKYRLAEAWDTDRSDEATMVRHCLSILATGTPLYIAYNWWGHALECVGLLWDESERNNLVWQIRNSHDEDDLIELTGAKAVPDEAYGIRATLTTI